MSDLEKRALELLWAHQGAADCDYGSSSCCPECGGDWDYRWTPNGAGILVEIRRIAHYRECELAKVLSAGGYDVWCNEDPTPQ